MFHFHCKCLAFVSIVSLSGPFYSGFRGLKSKCNCLDAGLFWGVFLSLSFFVFHLLIFLSSSLTSVFQSEYSKKLSSPLHWSFFSSSSDSFQSWHLINSLGNHLHKGVQPAIIFLRRQGWSGGFIGWCTYWLGMGLSLCCGLQFLGTRGGEPSPWIGFRKGFYTHLYGLPELFSAGSGKSYQSATFCCKCSFPGRQPSAQE